MHVLALTMQCATNGCTPQDFVAQWSSGKSKISNKQYSTIAIKLLIWNEQTCVLTFKMETHKLLQHCLTVELGDILDNVWLWAKFTAFLRMERTLTKKIFSEKHYRN